MRPLLLIGLGILPGVAATGVSLVMWRRRQPMAWPILARWQRLGYAWLGLFCLAAVVLTRPSDQDPELIAFGWIAGPVLASVLGIWALVTRQHRLVARWPDPQRMLALSLQAQEELGYLLTELGHDQERLSAAGLWPMTPAAVQLAALLGCCRTLDQQYAEQLRGLEAAANGAGGGRLPEAELAARQEAQHDLDDDLADLASAAVDCRVGVNQSLQEAVRGG